MTIDEAIEQLKFDREMIRFNPTTGEIYEPEELQYCVNKDSYNTYIADGIAIEALENQQKVVDYLEAQLKDAREEQLTSVFNENELAGIAYCQWRVSTCEKMLKEIKGGNGE